MNKQKTKKIKMDILLFKKYSKYVKQNNSIKGGINLFLTLKKCRSTCMIKIHKRYEKSFKHILKHYKMHYFTFQYKGDIFIEYIISNKPIPEEVKYAFQNHDYDVKNPLIIGKFLEYPSFINVRKVRDMKEIGGIQFNFMKEKYNKIKDINKYKELIYGFRIPNNKINSKIINKMNMTLKKYKKCIKKYLGEIFPDFVINMTITLN